MNTSYAFSRRGPDRVIEELGAVLVKNEPLEFKALFTIVYANLKARQAANGGEEMLRLRAYEKLQGMVQSGLVGKSGKDYHAVKKTLVPYLESLVAADAAPAPAQPAKPQPAKTPAAKSRTAPARGAAPKAPRTTRRPAVVS